MPDNRELLFLHGVPPAAVYLYLVTFLILPSDQKIYVYRSHGEGYEVYLLIRRYAIWFSGILYVTWSEILLRRHRKTISDQFSNLEKVNLQWLKILTYGMGCFAGAQRYARAPPGSRILIGLSGRGDKDMPTLQKTLLRGKL